MKYLPRSPAAHANAVKRGSLYAYYDPGQFRLTTPEADIPTYRWQSKIVAHNFCPNGGCGTFSDSPDFKPNAIWDGKTRRVGVTARVFHKFDAAAPQLEVIAGKNLW